MANRFDQIPENPNLYKQQSMFVPKEYIPTEMPDAPLNIPLDVYKADLKKRAEDKSKLDDDMSKFEAEHFKYTGKNVTSTYGGDDLIIKQKQLYDEKYTPYKSEMNRILKEYSNNPSMMKSAIRNVQDQVLADDDLRTLNTNVKTLENLEKQLSEDSDNPIVENQSVYKSLGELSEAARQGKVVDLKPAVKYKLGSKADALSKLKSSIDADTFGGESFVVDEVNGIAYTKSGKTKSVGDLRINQNFTNAWYNDPHLGQQVKTEATGYAEYAGYNVGKANNYLESLLTPEERALSQKEKESIFNKKLKDKETLGVYSQIINDKINPNYQSKVDGYVGKDKVGQVKNEIYNKYSKFTIDDLRKNFYNKFGIENIQSMSNINYDPFNKGAGAGSKLQPKTVVAFSNKEMDLGLSDIMDPAGNTISSTLYNAIDPDTGLLNEGTDPKLNESLAYLDNSMGQAITSMLGDGFIKDFKEAYGDKKITNSQIFNMLNANANNWIDGSKYAETMKKLSSSGKYNAVTDYKRTTGDVTYKNIDSKKLNESLNSLVKNNMTKEAVTVSKGGSKIIDSAMDSMFGATVNSSLLSENNIGDINIIENGVSRPITKEELASIKGGKNNPETNTMTLENENGKINVNFHTIDKKGVAKVIKIGFNSNSPNQKSAIIPIIKALHNQNDEVSKQQAISTAALTLSQNSDKIRAAMTKKTETTKPDDVTIINNDKTGSVTITYEPIKDNQNNILGYSPKALLTSYSKTFGSSKPVPTTDLNEVLLHTIDEEDLKNLEFPISK